jgi:hypothetical protein
MDVSAAAEASTVVDDSTDSTIAESATVAATKENRRGALTHVVSAGAVLLLIPIALYFWFIHQYGVNAIYYDQWDNVGLLTHTRFFFNDYSHTTVAALWTQHGEERWFFPNLIVLALGHFTNFNILVEQYLSAVLLVFGFALIILAHRRDVAHSRLVFYLPVAFLMFTLGQNEATLQGFNIWVYLVIAMLAATIFLLDLPRSSWLILVAAIMTAVIGSYSGLDALAIWPVGLGVLIWKGRPRAFMLTWVLAAVATTALFFYHYDFAATGTGNHAGHGFVLTHPWSAIQFFFFAIGDLVGGTLPNSLVGSDSDPVIFTIGVAVFLLAVFCLGVALYGRRRNPSRSPVGPALICYGLLLVLLVTVGRASVGLAGASRSRYAPEDLLILVGCYLCLLERWPGHEQESVAASFGAAFSAAVGAFRRADPIFPTIRTAWRQGLLVALRGVAILIIAVEVVGGIENGIPAGAAGRIMYQHVNLVTAHAACEPDSLIKSVLFPNGAYEWANIRGLAEEAKKDHLSFFATSEGSRLEHTKLPPGSYVPPKTSVLRPTSGEQVRGNIFLLAQASANCSISAVKFRIVGPGGQQYKVLPAEHFEYGYLGGWSTTDVPNGVYTVQSTAHDIAGSTGTSRGVPVTVQN